MKFKSLTIGLPVLVLAYFGSFALIVLMFTGAVVGRKVARDIETVRELYSIASSMGWIEQRKA